MISMAVVLLFLDGGSQLLGVSPYDNGIYHLLTIGSGAGVAIAVFDLSVLPMAIAYLGGFLLVAARRELFMPILFSAHIVGAMTIIHLSRKVSR
jgi:hypothetical protein